MMKNIKVGNVHLVLAGVLEYEVKYFGYFLYYLPKYQMKFVDYDIMILYA